MKKVKVITLIDNVEDEVKEFEIYEYNELNNKAKEKAVEDHYELMVEWNCDWLEDEVVNIMRDRYNITLKQGQYDYDFGYCQGSHFNFTNEDILNYSSLNNYMNKKDKESKSKLNPFELYVIENYDEKFINTLIDELNHGEFVDLKRDYGEFITTRYESYYTLAGVDMDDFFDNLYRKVYFKICDEMMDHGRSFIYPEEEDVVCDIEERETMFYEDGTVYSCL